MRAVNLVPKDYRRGRLAGKGGETFSYLVIGGLGVVLIAVLAIVMTNNSIASKKADVARLQQEELDAKARADELQPYATFASLQQARTATVSSLAQSRFDWERVMSELSKVIPPDVSLVQLSGTVLPDVTVPNDPGLPTRQSVNGPAVQLVGCAPAQPEVAAFVAALEDIDGVTRVGLELSDKSDATTASTGEGETLECRTDDQITKFSIVVAFDAAPVPPGAEAGAPLPPVPAPAPGDDGGVGQAQSQRAADQTSVQTAKEKSKKAADLIPGS